jgi:excisionase family DNA binding protein
MHSPQKAAGIAGVSRKTIVDAINAKKLYASRNNRNHWVISENDLKAWMDSRGANHIPDTSSYATTQLSL